MDALSEALGGMRITGAVVVDGEFTAPWGFTTPPSGSVPGFRTPGTEHLVLFHLVTEGRAVARVGQHQLELAPGDIVVIPHGDSHDLWNGRIRALVDGTGLLSKILAGELTVERGGGGGAVTRIICGSFGCERYAKRLFLAGLPPLFKVNLRGDSSGRWIEGSLRHLMSEVESGRVGRIALAARLTEALFIQTLCRFMDDLPSGGAGWLAAARDEMVGLTLALLHREPGQSWTLAELARRANTSRSVLAERFLRLVGEPPLAYLGRVRLQRGARLLETNDRTVLQVALEIGYGSEAAFSRAFKREFGVPPARYRRERVAPLPVPARSTRSPNGSRKDGITDPNVRRASRRLGRGENRRTRASPAPRAP